jgi:hypothetical protein
LEHLLYVINVLFSGMGIKGLVDQSVIPDAGMPIEKSREFFSYGMTEVIASKREKI